jgi:hypothetical protein
VIPARLGHMFGSVPAVRFAIGTIGEIGDSIGGSIGDSAVAARWQRTVAFMHDLASRRCGRSQRGATAPKPLRPVVVPASLDDLRGPAAGVVELPVRLYWSGSREFDLADQHQAADLCEAVLDTAATVADLSAYLNPDVLIHAWPVLGLNRRKREAWEERFPALRRQRLAAAA